MSAFSARLIALRKARGLSQSKTAKEVKIAPRAYQSYEYEEAEPKLSTLIRMADFYGVSLDYLAGRSDVP
ncbi:XRE family transcriptional regulator [Pseudoflavonifractor sp. 60]|uniref:helix-turn-helix domain-containing protein n=1 Tax=Pseudoflavonifractor sp. 60 TaxID=2304576 RepID=UPI0013698BC1|nr:helix-turn-helix transcriptional regulator [Pseudoflavonifractor sp. 60]NBI65750.1 XRE family transcriptional regulator [Pseudoflavonifractor sp. 60]